MATQLFLKLASASEASAPASYKRADRVRGSSVSSSTATLVTGPTAGIIFDQVWITDAFRGSETISSTVTFNIWGFQSNNNDNTGLHVKLFKWTPSGGKEGTPFVDSEHGTEMTTSASARNWTAAPTSTNFVAGDRVIIEVYANDAGGTMTAGTATVRYNANGVGTDGDSYVSFTENIGFTRVRTVKSSGGDYTSLSSAEAGEQGDLPALDDQVDLACYDFTDTGGKVDISGWITSATCYLRIYAVTGHAGVWDSSKYNLSVSTGFAEALVIQEDYVRIEGLQLDTTHATQANNTVGIINTSTAANTDIRVERCIIRRTGRQAGHRCVYHTSGKLTLRNSVIYGNLDGAGVYAIGGTHIEQNTTVVACSGIGIENAFSASTVTLDNVYSGGHTGAAYDGTMTRTTCAHSSATSFSGSTASIAYSTANFTNVTAGSENLHLVSGASSTLLTGGTDLSGTFTTDIDGQTRSDWSIGADEYIASAAGKPWNYYAQAA